LQSKINELQSQLAELQKGVPESVKKADKAAKTETAMQEKMKIIKVMRLG
jgi:hypothetical protein